MDHPAPGGHWVGAPVHLAPGCRKRMGQQPVACGKVHHASLPSLQRGRRNRRGWGEPRCGATAARGPAKPGWDPRAETQGPRVPLLGSAPRAGEALPAPSITQAEFKRAGSWPHAEVNFSRD